VTDAMIVDLEPVLRGLRDRPGMWGPVSKYDTVVTYILGLDEATGRTLLDGFQLSLAARYLGRERTNIAWWGLIVDEALPQFRTENRRCGQMTTEEDAIAIGELFDRLDEFLAGRGTSFCVARAG
jgi:hypothetical protein